MKRKLQTWRHAKIKGMCYKSDIRRAYLLVTLVRKKKKKF